MEVILLASGKLRVPHRLEWEDGTIGETTMDIDNTHPDFNAWLPHVTRRMRQRPAIVNAQKLTWEGKKSSIGKGTHRKRSPVTRR